VCSNLRQYTTVKVTILLIKHNDYRMVQKKNRPQAAVSQKGGKVSVHYCKNTTKANNTRTK